MFISFTFWTFGPVYISMRELKVKLQLPDKPQKVKKTSISHTIKSQALDRSIIQFWGCYYLRCATNQGLHKGYYSIFDLAAGATN